MPLASCIIFYLYHNYSNVNIIIVFSVSPCRAPGSASTRQSSAALPAEVQFYPATVPEVETLPAVPELTSLLTELRCVTEHMQSVDDKEKEINDWKFAAMVIDRLCFWLFSVYLLLLNVVFLGLAASRLVD